MSNKTTDELTTIFSELSVVQNATDDEREELAWLTYFGRGVAYDHDGGAYPVDDGDCAINALDALERAVTPIPKP